MSVSTYFLNFCLDCSILPLKIPPLMKFSVAGNEGF